MVLLYVVDAKTQGLQPESGYGHPPNQSPCTFRNVFDFIGKNFCYLLYTEMAYRNELFKNSNPEI